MSKTAYSVLAVLFASVVVLAWMVSSLSAKIERQGKTLGSIVKTERDSLVILQRQVDSLRQQVPGLGEYMSGIQLHISKLWFAGKASNWDLASYELNELGEAVDGAEALHATRDSVDITSVLQSVHNTQLEMLKQSISGMQQGGFREAYTQTLEACNGCHRSAGYTFIHIVPPAAPPVTNQRWERGKP